MNSKKAVKSDKIESSKITIDLNRTPTSKFLTLKDLPVWEYDKTCYYVCYCNSDRWCVKCNGEYDDFF